MSGGNVSAEQPPEAWTPVVGWEFFCEVSNKGRVRRTETRRVLGMRPHRGYETVFLCRPGSRGTHRVHRLVAEAFLGLPPFAGAHVCHFDGDRRNNLVSNLRWGTAAENAADRARHGREVVGAAVNTAKLTEQKVIDLRRKRATGKSTRKLAAEFGLSFSAAWAVATGRTWRHVQQEI